MKMKVYKDYNDAFKSLGDKWFRLVFDPVEIKDIDEEYLAALKNNNSYNGRFSLSDKYLISDEEVPEMFTGTANTKEELTQIKNHLYTKYPESFKYFLSEFCPEDIIILPIVEGNFNNISKYVISNIHNITGLTINQIYGGKKCNCIKFDEISDINSMPKKITDNFRKIYPVIEKHLKENSKIDLDYDGLYHFILFELIKEIMEY